MAYVLGSPFVQTFSDANGIPVSNGTLEFYLTGDVVPTDVYSDANGTSQGSVVSLGTRGQPVSSGGTPIALFFDDEITYKIVVKDALGTAIPPTIDPYSPAQSPDQAVSNYGTVSAMTAASIGAGRVVTTKGYHTAGDGGDASYYVKTFADYGGTPDEYGDLTLANGNVAVLQHDGEVSLRQFGAKGDGSTDDAPAIQAALDYGVEIRQHGGNFKFGSTLTLPAGTHMYMTSGATLTKDFVGTGLRNTNYATPASTDDDYILHGLRIRQSSTAQRGNVVELVNVSNVDIEDYNCVQIATTTATGAWSLYLSGDNIRISRPFIDSTAGTIYADGIHVAYAKNLSITDGIILAGDDAIALFPPNKAWANAGKDQAGGGVIISNMILGSTNANLIRLGASGAATESSDALPNVVYDGVTIKGVVDAGLSRASGTVIKLSDTRATSDIVGQHDNIIIDDIVIRRVSSEGVIRLNGNPDITNAANVGQKNYKSVTLRNVRCDNSNNGATVSGGGVEDLLIDSCDLRRTYVATSAAYDFDTIDDLKIRDCHLRTGSSGTTGTGYSSNLVLTTEFENVNITSGGEFRTLNMVSNATQNTTFRMQGGSIRAALRGIDDTGGTGIHELMVRGTLFDCSTSDITAAALAATTLEIEKVGEYATSDGTTGGTGSAGAGTQYVELDVGGTVYKVLHDGTV